MKKDILFLTLAPLFLAPTAAPRQKASVLDAHEVYIRIIQT